MNQIFREEKGFTLVEIAIVMIIVGLLLGLGAGMVGPLMKRAKIIDTREIINAAVDSVISYATSSKRMPVWRDANDAVTAPNEFHYLLRNRNDAWGNPLFYTYDGALFNNDICGKKTTALSIVQCADSACTPATQIIINNVAFIVYSRGENMNYQTILPGGSADVPVPVPPVIAYVYPTDVTMNANRVSGNISIPNTQPLLTINDPVDDGCGLGDARCMYDDIAKWITLDELRTKMGCQGAQMRIVNNELPSGNVANIYGAAVFADGGIPYAGGNYLWCLQPAAPPGLTPSPNVVSANCQALAEVSWGQATFLQFSKTAGAGTAGSYNFTVFARDNNDAAGTNDNITQKVFVITISP
ncbi:MAG: prepilin-type N-terminal cleavage/methylation domain-containing protein [Proteobacteria bacterium]|nr:prepilin-type N-terminal cleavage/methylation domain-containing protein [Pseudomonadota bacterium]MBU4581604.1 prepilin-type N-terminal cleavage/methylation domain-containing protein [Pseudomonadota bacterium]MCG2739925.1 prepilin-type N-terminal cleavage/methylation domain-containing protein [Syntrophaceae bacterium]